MAQPVASRRKTALLPSDTYAQGQRLAGEMLTAITRTCDDPAAVATALDPHWRTKSGPQMNVAYRFVKKLEVKIRSSPKDSLLCSRIVS